MPVLLEPHRSNSLSDSCLHIGLINNMSDEALKATERQYASLLHTASDGVQILLSFYTLPGIPRSGHASRHIASTYSNINDLWGGHLDGVIVTGREPVAEDLREEPYWQSLTRTLAWAEGNVHSTVWSCLAAHAAVLHMDGIKRTRRNDKLFGVFKCILSSDHPLMAELPSELELPQSRWNSISPDKLAEAGYRVLTRTHGGEVDTFIKQQNKLFVFFQGHPEYEADTLLREYRRDVAQYLRGETTRYPLLPENYFSYEIQAMLHDLEKQYASTRPNELPFGVSEALSKINVSNTWRESAVILYENWLSHIQVQKNTAMRSKILLTQPLADAAQTRSVQV